MMPANSAPCSKNARNFAFAAAASARSCRSRSSAWRWRVTSRTIFDAPMTLPSSSLIGEIVSDTTIGRPSLPHALGLEMVDAPPGPQARDDLVLLAEALGRDHQRDVAADRLLGGVAEQPLGGRVPALDRAVERLADDRVVGRFDDRRELARREQSGLLLVLELPLRGDVAEDQHAARDAPCSSRIGAALSSIGCSVPSRAIRIVWLARPTTAPSRSARVAGFSTGWRSCSLTIRNTSSSGRPRASALGPAGQRFGDRVEVGDAAVDVGRDHRVADARQRDAQQLAVLAGARARAAHRLADGDDQRAREQVSDQTDEFGCSSTSRQHAARRDEQVVQAA